MKWEWDATKIALAAVGVIIIAVAVWWFLTEPGRERQKAAEAQAQAKAAQGQAAAGQAAIGTIGRNNSTSNGLDAQQAETNDAIRKASPGDSNSVTLQRLCLSASYRDQPACKQLLVPSPK